MSMADQNRPDQPVEISGTEARGGAPPGVTRYVLAFGLILVIIVFAVIYNGAFW